MSRIASVVINNSTREYDREYHYLIPDLLADKVRPGVRVIVPFGGSNRSREAYVFRLLDNTAFGELKEIKRVLDETPVLSEGMLELASWMKGRYICTFSDAIKCMLPAGIGMKSTRMVRLTRHEGHECTGLKDDHIKILDVIAANGNECEYVRLQECCGVKGLKDKIRKLEESGLVKVYDEYTPRVREKTVKAAYLAIPPEEAADQIEKNRIKRIQQIRVLEMLMENRYIAVSDIIRFAGVSSGVLDTLKKYGFVGFTDLEVKRDPLKHRVIERTQPMVPTREQEKALLHIKDRLDKNIFDEVLLHGITGSGKTEVYLQLISHVLEKGKTAIVMVPEISLTPQMVERFKGRFGDDVAVLHSRLSLGERYDQWKLIRDGGVKVVVGARSAVFAPLRDLGAIIIDEEHEGSYKSEITPKYHAADIARKRCADENAVLVYGSATPSIDTYFRAAKGEIGFMELKERTNSMLLPEVKTVDMRKELDEGNRSIFSRLLKEEIEQNLKSGRQTMLFLNRRGYASFILCRNCGYTMKCAGCNISLTYHAHDGRLICHYCGYTVKAPGQCPKCGSGYIKQFGTGTQRVEEEVKKHFPGCSVIRMDMDTTAAKNSHEEILTAFREKNINIMVGTQMIAKGHDFPNVTLVGVLAADSLLNIEDFRASEKTFQLITQVSGRAGRGEIPGRVIIQTYNTEDFSILAACGHDYASFYKQEIKLREMLGYPPFSQIGVLVFGGVNDRSAFEEARAVKDYMDAALSESGIDACALGPARCPISRIKNRFRWRIIVKSKDRDKLAGLLERVSDEFFRRSGKNCVDLSVDINPFSML